METLTLNNSHNPYFNRWFSAIENRKNKELLRWCHNPYFNRWFSAIVINTKIGLTYKKSQSLF